MFTCGGLFFSVILLTVAVMDLQTGILQLRVWMRVWALCLYHPSCWNIYHPVPPGTLSPSSVMKCGLLPVFTLFPSLQLRLCRGRGTHALLSGWTSSTEAPPGVITASIRFHVYFKSARPPLRMFNFPVEGRRTFRMCVRYRARVCAQHVYVCSEKEERKWNSALNELWSVYCYLPRVLRSAWTNGIRVGKPLCVLGVVSGSAWIACGCLAGLIPLNSTISFHSFSTKTCPPAKLYWFLFYVFFFLSWLF